MPSSPLACAVTDLAPTRSRSGVACAILGSLACAQLGGLLASSPTTAVAAPRLPGVVPASDVVAARGDLPTTPQPDRDAAAIAALRARGPAGLAAILREYDAASPRTRDRLGATVDAVAAQRYASVSRLYWYTELEAAQAEAARRKKPILALRLLGRLDEDLSCANSRFFRTALYSNKKVAELLRTHFVLLWTTERPVPRVTIDFGEGRALVGTVTGNSIHYVLDAEGRVLDALPGLYAPEVFVAELEQARALAAELRTLASRAPEAAEARLLRHLDRERHDVQQAFLRAGDAVWDPEARRLLADGEAGSALARAQRAALSKARVEVALVHQIAAGADPGTFDPSDVARWASIGQAMFGIGEVHGPADGAPGARLPLGESDAGPRRARQAGAAYPAATAADASSANAQAPVLPVVLDAPARRLVAEVAYSLAPPRRPTTPGAAETVHDAPALIARFEQLMVADTAKNQLRLRPRILAQLRRLPRSSLEELNRWVYDEVFATPAQDSWLGLRTLDGYTGLPGDGAVLVPPPVPPR
jgi:hypothetical protein